MEYLESDDAGARLTVYKVVAGVSLSSLALLLCYPLWWNGLDTGSLRNLLLALCVTPACAALHHRYLGEKPLSSSNAIPLLLCLMALWGTLQGIARVSHAAPSSALSSCVIWLSLLLGLALSAAWREHRALQLASE